MVCAHNFMWQCALRHIQATKDFEKGEYVVEYAGELIDSKTAKARNEQYGQDDSIGSYMYHFQHDRKLYW